MQLRYIFLLSLFGLLSNCNLEEVNVNPNDPSDVPLETLLPPAEQALMEALTGDAAILAGIFVNYFEGVENRFLSAETYFVDRDFLMRPIWEDFYVDALTTLHLINRKAAGQNAPHYEGVARILTVLGISTVTDAWGDVPFTSAFSGPENLAPTYDGQDELYVRLESELDKAIANLAEAESIFSPQNDDLFFNGDLEAWTRVAHSLKARLLMRQSNRKTGVSNQVLDLLASGIQTREDALVYPFNELEPNPWFQFQATTPYLRIDEDFQDLVDDDPRESFLIKSTFGEKLIGPYFADQYAPVFLISYDEMLFLTAEAHAREGETAEAEQALRSAVEENIDRVTNGEADPVEVTDYLDQQTGLTGNLEVDLEIILRQKYIALFTSLESWADFRRTGFPDLPPNPDGTNPDNPGGEIPRRFLYPINEVLYNPNVPTPQPNLQTPVWWDMEG
jgi:hypothetical protein